MSRRKFGSALIASSLLVFSAITVTTLSSCGGPAEQQVVESKITSIAISTKTDLTKEWHVGQESRKIGIIAKEGEKEINVQNALVSGEITITSSNTNVVAVSGLMLQPKAEGKVTITVAVRGKADLKDTVEIEVKEALVKATTVAEIHKNLEPGLKKKDAESTYEYIVEGKVVSADKDSYCTVNDGTGLITVFGGKDVKTVSVGDVVKVTGKLSNYWGAIQFKFPTITKSTKTVGELKATKYDAAKFEAYKTFQGKNDSEIKDGAVKPEFIEAALVYKGKTDKTVDFQIKDSQLMVNVAKSDPAVLAEIDKLTVGNTYTVTGSLLGWNGGHNYFNITANTAVLAEEGKKVESITISAEATELKIGQFVKLSSVKNPADAAGEVEYSTVGTTDVIEVKFGKITALKAGTAKVVGKIGDVVSNELTITVANEELAPEAISTIYSKKKGDQACVYGIYMGQFAQSPKQGLFFQDGESATVVYGVDNVEGISVGDHVKINGTLDVFNGSTQIKFATLTKLETSKAKAAVIPEVKGLEGFAGKDTARRVKVTGKVKEDGKKDKHGNGHFAMILDDGKELSVRADSRYDSLAEIDKFAAFKKDQVVTIEGNFAFYKGGLETIPTTNEGIQIVNPKVYVDPTAATKVTLTSKRAEIKVNDITALSVALEPAEATDPVEITVKAGSEEFIKVFKDKEDYFAKGLKAGEATLVVTAGAVSSELKITVTAEVLDVYAGATATTIAEIKAETLETAKMHKITGVLTKAADSDYGNVTLTDKATGETLDTYGLSSLDAFQSIDGTLSYDNKKVFKTELLGTEFNLGDEIEIYAKLEKKYDKDTHGVFKTTFIKRTAEKSTIKYNLGTLPEYLTASKTTDIIFGEEITLTLDKAKLPEGKVIKSLKVDGTEIAPEADGVTYKFNAGIINKIEVVLKGEGEVDTSSVLTVEALGLPSQAYSSSKSPVTASGLSVTYFSLGNYGDGIQGRGAKKGNPASLLYLEEATDLEIDSIVIASNANKGSSAVIGVKFGTTKITSAKGTAETLQGSAENGATVKFTSDVAGAKYFALEHLSGGSFYLDSITINYKTATSK